MCLQQAISYTNIIHSNKKTSIFISLLKRVIPTFYRIRRNGSILATCFYQEVGQHGCSTIQFSRLVSCHSDYLSDKIGNLSNSFTVNYLRRWWRTGWIYECLYKACNANINAWWKIYDIRWELSVLGDRFNYNMRSLR